MYRGRNTHSGCHTQLQNCPPIHPFPEDFLLGKQTICMQHQEASKTSMITTTDDQFSLSNAVVPDFKTCPDGFAQEPAPLHLATETSYVGHSCRSLLPPAWSSAMRKILLPSAVHLKERLTVSQSVSQPGQQSVRQKQTVWVFCQWQTQLQAVGRTASLRASSGRMVLQPAADFLVGGSNPGRAKTTAAPPTTVNRPGFEPPT